MHSSEINAILVLFFRPLACTEDWIEIYIIFREGNDRFIGRYCGVTAPGPVESPRGASGVRIQLHTDAENVSSGFKARYIFEVAKAVTGKCTFVNRIHLLGVANVCFRFKGDCGGNYTGQESDVIESPNYPGKKEKEEEEAKFHQRWQTKN